MVYSFSFKVLQAMNGQCQRYHSVIVQSTRCAILDVPGVHVVNVSKRFQFIDKPCFIYYRYCFLFEAHRQVFNDNRFRFRCRREWMNQVPTFTLQHFKEHVTLIVDFDQCDRLILANDFGNFINDS